MQHESDYTTLIAVNEVIKFAEQLPIDILTTRNHEPKYPVTASERLVSYVLHLLITKQWQVYRNEAATDEIESILCQLDTGVDAPKEWQALFDANHELSDYLDKNI
jgi:hypothetical protein